MIINKKIKDKIRVIFGALLVLPLIVISFSNINNIIPKEAKASPICPSGFTFVSNTTCLNNVLPIVTNSTVCPNQQAPASPGQCIGNYQNGFWNCSENRPNQVAIAIADNYGNPYLCTFSQFTSKFTEIKCKYNSIYFDNGIPAGPYGQSNSGANNPRANAFEKVFNEFDKNTIPPVCQSAASEFDPLCDGTPASWNTCQAQQCPNNFRPIFGWAHKRYGTDQDTDGYYKDATLLCVEIAFLPSTGYNDSLWIRAAGISGSFAFDRECGSSKSPGYSKLVEWAYDPTDHQERMMLCTRPLFAPATQITTYTCPSGTTPNSNPVNTSTLCQSFAQITGYTQVTQSNIQSMSCTPITSNFGTQITCNATLINNVNNYATGNVKFDLGPNGDFGSCIPNQGFNPPTQLSISCNITPNTTGNPISVNATLQPTGTIIGLPSLTINDIAFSGPLPPITCIKNPQILSNSFADCYFNIPVGTFLPNGYKFGIGDSTPNALCTPILAGMLPYNIRCLDTPTGSVGSQAGTSTPIFVIIGNGQKTQTSSNTNVFSFPLTPTDIPNVTGFSCTSPSQVNSSTSCNFKLPAGRFLPVNFGLKISDGIIGTSCTTASNNVDVTCVNIPTGTISGNFPVNMVFGTSLASSGFNIDISSSALDENGIKNSNLTCNSGQSVPVNSTTTCTFNLNDGISLPNNLKFGIGNSTPSGSCSAIATLVTCVNIPAGSEVGNNKLIFGQFGTAPKFDTTKTINVTGSDLVVSDLPNLIYTCTKPDGSVPMITISKVKCQFNLPVGKTLPFNLKLALGDSNLSGSCTLINIDQALVECVNVNTGTQTPNQNLFASINNGARTDTTKSFPVTGTNLASAIGINISCSNQDSSPILINTTTTCTFTLPEGSILTPGITFGIGNILPAGNCVLTSPSNALVTCTNVPVGPDSGSIPIFGKIPNKEKENTGKFAIVGGVAINNGDLINSDLQCGNGQDILINSKTTCTFTLPNSKFLPNTLGLSVGDADPSGECSIGQNQIVTCTNVPTGSKVGTNSIFSKINSGNKEDTNKTANLYKLPDPIIPTPEKPKDEIPTQVKNNCLAGYYSTSNKCEICPIDSYCTGQYEYKKPCPNNYKNQNLGKKSISECDVGLEKPKTDCPVGTFLTFDKTSCWVCVAGYYCIGGMSRPISCTFGNYCPTGSSQTLKCKQGFKTNREGSASESECEIVTNIEDNFMTIRSGSLNISNQTLFSISAIGLFGLILTNDKKDRSNKTWKKII